MAGAPDAHTPHVASKGAWEKRLPCLSPAPEPEPAPPQESPSTSNALSSPSLAVKKPKKKPPALFFSSDASPQSPLQSASDVLSAAASPDQGRAAVALHVTGPARPVLRIANNTLFVGKYSVDQTGCTSNPMYLLLVSSHPGDSPQQQSLFSTTLTQHAAQTGSSVSHGRRHGSASPIHHKSGSNLWFGNGHGHYSNPPSLQLSAPSSHFIHPQPQQYGSPVQSTPPLRSTNMGLPVSPMVYVTDKFPGSDVQTPVIEHPDDQPSGSGDSIGSRNVPNTSFMIGGQSRLNFDDISILERLSNGATGEVFRAKHEPTQKIIAVKVMDLSPVVDAYYASRGHDELVVGEGTDNRRLSPCSQFTEDALLEFLQHNGSFGNHAERRGAERVEQLQAAVLRELRVLHSHYRSPHVLKMYDAFFRDSKLYIVMEYMEYGSLENIGKLLDPTGLGHRHPLPERILAVVAEQMLNGLRDMHLMGHIHRDIKPSNILLSAQGAVKLADFGLCEDVTISLLTDDNEHCSGTNHFMSPERQKGEPHGAASDIWALGLTLADCAVGRYPIDLSGCRDTFELMSRMAQPVHFPAYLTVQLTENFKSFIREAMRPDPKQRPSAEALLCHSLLSQWRGEFDFREFLQTAIKSAAKQREVVRAVAKASQAKAERMAEDDFSSIEHVEAEPDYCIPSGKRARRGTSGQRGQPVVKGTAATSRSSSASSAVSRGTASPNESEINSPIVDDDAAIAVALQGAPAERVLSELEKDEERRLRRERELVLELQRPSNAGTSAPRFPVQAFEAKRGRTAELRAERRKRMSQ